MKSPKPPATPTYYPAPSYTAPAPQVIPQYQAAPDPNSVIPQVFNANQVMQYGAEAESQLPQWLQFGDQNPLDPAGRSEAEQYFYQTQIAPLLAQQQASSYNSGQNSGSYAGAMAGQLAAQGALSKYQAGLDYANQLYQSQLQGRSSYYAGGPTVAAQQNAADVNRGMNVSQLQQQAANNQNNFNLGSAANQNSYGLQSAGMQNNYGLASSGAANSFGLSNYQNQLQAYQLQQQQQAQRFGALTGGLSTLAGGLTGIKMPSFGGGYSGATSSGSGTSGGTTLGSLGFGGVLGGLQQNQVGSFGGGYGGFS